MNKRDKAWLWCWWVKKGNLTWRNFWIIPYVLKKDLFQLFSENFGVHSKQTAIKHLITESCKGSGFTYPEISATRISVTLFFYLFLIKLHQLKVIYTNQQIFWQSCNWWTLSWKHFIMNSVKSHQKINKSKITRIRYTVKLLLDSLFPLRRKNINRH